MAGNIDQVVIGGSRAGSQLWKGLKGGGVLEMNGGVGLKVVRVSAEIRAPQAPAAPGVMTQALRQDPLQVVWPVSAPVGLLGQAEAQLRSRTHGDGATLLSQLPLPLQTFLLLYLPLCVLLVNKESQNNIVGVCAWWLA